MAKTDIMGLLTGVSSQGIDPMAQLSPAQQRMEFGARRARGLSGAVRGLLGGEAPIREQIAVRMVEKQLQDKAKRKEQIRRVAEALPEEYSALAQGVIDEVQGALPKALEVLGRKTTEDKNQEGEKPSGTDIKAMKILLSTAGEEAKGKEGGFFGAFSTDWNDAWKKMSDYQQEQVATAVAEARCFGCRSESSVPCRLSFRHLNGSASTPAIPASLCERASRKEMQSSSEQRRSPPLAMPPISAPVRAFKPCKRAPRS